MSYIAKVYLNRMFPKKGEDVIRVEGDNLVITFINAMNPITANEPPKDLLNSFEIIGDGSPIAGKGAPDTLNKMKAVWKDLELTAENYMEIKDKTIPQGDKCILYVPNTLGWASGEKHKIQINLIQDRPISLSIQRTIG
jgi:hypothetical protein